MAKLSIWQAKLDRKESAFPLCHPDHVAGKSMMWISILYVFDRTQNTIKIIEIFTILSWLSDSSKKSNSSHLKKLKSLFQSWIQQFYSVNWILISKLSKNATFWRMFSFAKLHHLINLINDFVHDIFTTIIRINKDGNTVVFSGLNIFIQIIHTS